MWEETARKTSCCLAHLFCHGTRDGRETATGAREQEPLRATALHLRGSASPGFSTVYLKGLQEP